MKLLGRKSRYYYLAFLKHDLKSSITVFFVALPLCLGISLASNAPLYSGLIAGIIGGLVISLISNSQLSVSGPAAGLTALSVVAIAQMGSIQVFFLSVAIAGILQILMGVFRLGGFTNFIPSSVIKGMLAAIGIILITKQIPLFIGYDHPDFWKKEMFNILSLNHVAEHFNDIYLYGSIGVAATAVASLLLLILWKKILAKRLPFIPTSFVVVIFGIVIALLFNRSDIPALTLKSSQFVKIPQDLFAQMKFPQFGALFTTMSIWTNAFLICFMASLETLLSIEAIDELDPYNRVTSQNQELVAQGIGNFLSGLLGGIPITAVIVRSSANAEAGAKTRLSAFTHGLWLLLVVLFAVSFVNLIPFCVLAVILIRTGYNLAKPSMIIGVYKQGREQFLPFVVTVVVILVTNLLIGVLVGSLYAIYFLVKHTYRAGYSVKERQEGHIKHYNIDLALNVSFLNKKRFIDLLDKIPEYSVVEINGTKSVYIDHDVLEVFQNYRAKAHNRHIDLNLIDIPEVETIAVH